MDDDEHHPELENMARLGVPGEEPHRRRSSSPRLLDRVQLFDRVAQEHAESQATNPFSDHFQGRVSPRPDDPDYGKPKAGSKTELRGKKASSQVHKEMLELCTIISEHGEPLEGGGAVILFGELFQIYTYISNKVVGLLLRARKQKLVDFEGETLFQRRDDDVPIVLLMPLEQVREHFRKQDGE
ncbi:actin-binding Rho-activating protein-like [Schistocerca americana]|uniref:actin-binding Rho-activating protein-like n=1 Tax=Schistocerca americana TaxID=7009 RepID=UPI001F4FECE3|nr:actin-binding Rho-activating protein-like [Schistocerca americana]XP_049944819.1 actin-binding Rho-activating protein-like [Schistocerca serialis cubense]